MSRSILQQHITSIEQSRGDRPQIAFFDLDGTLVAGYSILALAWETARRGASRGQLGQSARLVSDLLRQRAQRSGGSYHRVVRRLTGALTGTEESTLEELGRSAYSNILARSLYREAIALVEAHRAAGHELVMVTAATRYQAEPVARVLGISRICCTRLEVVDGRFSGKVITPMCYGEGKALAARRVSKQLRGRLEDAWFYTDSSADLPLLRDVGKPVAVNPSERLAAHARAKGWTQLEFGSRGVPRVEHIVRTLLTAQTLAATTAVSAVGRRLGFGGFASANSLTRFLGDVGSGFAGLDFEIEGLENLRKERPAIYTFNHQSLLDALVLAHILREDVVALCKQEMAANPVLGPMLRQVDTIFVDRDEKDQRQVLQRALEVLGSGRSLVIAPEGTRSTLGNIQPFKHGAFLLAKKARVPIVPIVLHNVKDALPKGGFLIRPATIRITVLPPIHPGAIGSVRQTCDELEARYTERLGRSEVAALPYRARA
ncbi:HAD-IB family hydrolase [Halieaceae bacterium]|nr:HAD-IB family hydrolase [Halieaceae bacterium]